MACIDYTNKARIESGACLPSTCTWHNYMQVKMLDKLAQAVVAVEHRKTMYGRRAPEQQGTPSVGDIAQVRLSTGAPWTLCVFMYVSTCWLAHKT